MKDELGRPTGPTEQRLLAIYLELKALRTVEGLPPVTEANLRHALACLWNVVNGLGLAFEQIIDHGV
ncbi:MAG TPA: hypothetical protein VD902_20570 [Symbiobacteriaceae bacterium]|nr:hypothetical protein [Symbiobacteriaceae bacterium]